MTTIKGERDRLLSKVIQNVDEALGITEALYLEELPKRVESKLEKIEELQASALTTLYDVVGEHYIDNSDQLKMEQLELDFGDPEAFPDDAEFEENGEESED